MMFDVEIFIKQNNGYTRDNTILWYKNEFNIEANEIGYKQNNLSLEILAEWSRLNCN